MKRNELLPHPEIGTELVFGEFEYLPTNHLGVLFDIEAIMEASANLSQWGEFGQLLALPPLIESFFSLLLLLCFLLFSLVFRHESMEVLIRLKNTVLFRSSKTAVYSEQVSPFKIRGNIYLIVQTAIIVSIVVSLFIMYDCWNLHTLSENLLFFTGILVAILLFFGMKYTMYKAIGSFFLGDDIENYTSRYFWTIKALGFLLLIPAIICIYVGELRSFMFMVSVVIFFISRIIIFAELLNIFAKNKIDLLCFFVYFCGTEIAPYMLYIKGVFLLTNIVENIVI